MKWKSRSSCLRLCMTGAVRYNQFNVHGSRFWTDDPINIHVLCCRWVIVISISILALVINRCRVDITSKVVNRDAIFSHNANIGVVQELSKLNALVFSFTRLEWSRHNGWCLTLWAWYLKITLNIHWLTRYMLDICKDKWSDAQSYNSLERTHRLMILPSYVLYIVQGQCFHMSVSGHEFDFSWWPV